MPVTRIHGNPTLVKMGDYWAPNRPNPGYYARKHYGYNVLKHSKHWLEHGRANSWVDYHPKPRFGPCAQEGHHLCLNQYLGDGIYA